MFAPDHTAPEFAFTPIGARSLIRRLAPLALLAGAGLLMVVLAGGRIHAFADALRRGLALNGGWAAVGILFECLSLAGYVWLLSLVAGRATPRIGTRESAQITLAGAAATRLLPTAGAGGAGLALWTLRRAGLRPRVAARTLLVFLVVLYSVFLAAMVLSGAALALGLAASQGPTALSVVPAAAAAVGVALALALAARCRERSDSVDAGDVAASRRGSRLRSSAQLLGDSVRDACRLVRSGDPRLAGAVAYWAFDAAVLWAMLHAFGAPPALPVVALAYLLGQVANTVPLPGSVSGGIAGVLIALGVPVGLALPSVLAYRTVSVWLPTPMAVAALPGLRSTIERWRREEAAASV
jgi:putative heme transporter